MEQQPNGAKHIGIWIRVSTAAPGGPQGNLPFRTYLSVCTSVDKYSKMITI